VAAGPDEVVQPFCQLRQVWVGGDAGNFGGEPISPSPICIGIGESYLELLLEDSGGAAELSCPGGSQVAGIDLFDGAQAGPSAATLRRTLSASWAIRCDWALRYGPRMGSAAMR
jgi:hypothetical protein